MTSTLVYLPCECCGEDVPIDADLADEGLEILCRECFCEANPDLAAMIPLAEAAQREAVRTQLRALVALAHEAATDAA